MTTLSRRFFMVAAALAAVVTFRPEAWADDLKELKIGYQKTGLPVIARQQKLIEQALEPKGVAVSWVEFNAGPPLVEALNAAAIDVGWVGDAPPIFGQAAGSAIVYVAALPGNLDGEAIVTKADSGINSIADLKGKKVAVGKGTSAHNLLVAALEKYGVAYGDIEPVYLPPPDAGAAFAADKVDAWSIWDPFLAVAETNYKPKVLVRSPEVLKVNTYFLANKSFAGAHPETLGVIIKQLGLAADWADKNRDKVAAALHEVTGVPLEAQTLAAGRAKFGIFPITEDIIANQQATADRFFKLGLIPKAIKVADAVWTPPAN